MNNLNLHKMAGEIRPISHGNISDHGDQQRSSSPDKSSAFQSASQSEPSYHDIIDAEIQRMVRVREEENEALTHMLNMQQQLQQKAAAAAAVDSSSSTQFNSMTDFSTSGSSFRLPQINVFLHEPLMNNISTDNLGMRNIMRQNGANNALDSQFNNSMPSSLMNRSMDMNQMDFMGSDHQTSIQNTLSSAAAGVPSPYYNKADLPSNFQMNNFTPQSFSSNHQDVTSVGSPGMSDYIKNINQLMSRDINNVYLPPLAAVNHQPSPQEDPGWEDQYKALRAYRLSNGNCRVPARYKANPKLGRWVMTQRRQFTVLMQGLPSALTAERIQRLESLGFTWSVRPEPASTWNRRFQELKAYNAAHSNCLVPQRYRVNPQLGTWVHTQRRQYKLMKEGKKSSMNKEKADALESIGFFWAAANSASSSSSSHKLPIDDSLSDLSDHSEHGNDAA